MRTQEKLRGKPGAPGRTFRRRWPSRELDYPLLGKTTHVTDEVDVSLVKPRPRRYETAGAASAAAKSSDNTSKPKDSASSAAE